MKCTKQIVKVITAVGASMVFLTQPASAAQSTITYDYDAANRMVRAGVVDYERDAAGNLTRVVAPFVPSLELAAPVASFGDAAQVHLSIVLTANIPWTAVSSEPGWLTIAGPASGTGSATLAYALAQNPGAARTGRITVTQQGGGLTATLDVTQAASTTVTLTPSVTHHNSTAQNGRVHVVSAASWTAVSSAPTWLSVSPSGPAVGTLYYYVSPNATGSPRQALITVVQVGSGVMASIQVNQDAASSTTWYTPVFHSQEARPIAASGFSAFGKEVHPELRFEPQPGTDLLVVENSGLAPIIGEFSNLAEGSNVTLNYEGRQYEFIASYFGGTGNDLVLRWKDVFLAAWGNNYWGQYGNGTNSTSIIPIQVDGGTLIQGKRVIKVSGGVAHSVALCADGEVYAAGSNEAGQLGISSVSSSSTWVRVDLPPPQTGRKVVDIACGSHHSLALYSDGEVMAWGAAGNGRLGAGFSAYSSMPVTVVSDGALLGRKVVKIAAGYSHSLAVCADGRIASWGANGNGELGTGNFMDSTVPTVVSLSAVGKSVAEISAGGNHTLVCCTDGTLVGWGLNAWGELGNGGNSTMPTIITMTGALAGKFVTSVATGFNHSYALCSDGTLAAWGRNDFGQLGNNTVSSTPFPVHTNQAFGPLAGTGIKQLLAGDHCGMAICTNGTVAAWGYNGVGQLGSGDYANAASPRLVITGGLPVGALLAAGFPTAGTHSFGLVAQPPPAEPNVAVFENLDGNLTNLSSGVSVSDLGSSPLNTTSPRAVGYLVRNTGAAILTDVSFTVSGSHAQDFHIQSLPGTATLNPGGAIGFGVTFRPTGPGKRSATLTIHSNDPDEAAFIVALKGRLDSPPTVSPLTNVVIDQGGTVTVPVTFFDEENNITGYGWNVDQYLFPAGGVQLNGSGESRQLVLTPDPSRTGSTPFELEVVDASNQRAFARFTIHVIGPEVPPPVLEVECNGTRLTAGSAPSTSEGTRFPFTPLGSTEVHSFVIRNSGGSPLVIQRLFSTNYHLYPVLSTGWPATLQPSQTATLDVRFWPSSPGTESAEITMETNDSLQPTFVLNFTASAAVQGTAGKYVALIGRRSGNGQLGGRLDVTVSGTGAATGSALIGRSRYAFKGAMDTVTGVLTVRSSSPAGLWIANASTDRLAGFSGLISRPGMPLTDFKGWRNTWNTLYQATPYQGICTFASRLPSPLLGEAAIPQGSNFGRIAVKPSTGTATVIGRVADDLSTSPLLTTAPLGPNGEVLLFQSRYAAPYGSIMGSAVLRRWSDELTGTMTWQKNGPQPVTVRTYPSGFGPVELAIEGGRYTPVIKPGYILGLSPLSDHASITFSHGYVETSIDHPNRVFVVKPPSVAMMPSFASGQNPTKTSLSINAGTGLFTGSFTVMPNARMAKFQGVIIQGADGLPRGRGFFLLSDPFIAPGKTSRTNEVRSGLVEITAGTAGVSDGF